ncbi:hypothetical protein [Thiomicrorhabdus indica]|uniref:hypothetical protein n=1 Tax=Thiomicrorhabdus indica TaxID=2267253 RepID=UPI002AA809E8|nr:hypothetical protein [Thiomicrorhabdus indica]
MLSLNHFLVFKFQILFTIVFFSLLTTPFSLQAGQESDFENSHWPKDAWFLEYEYDDFSDEIEFANLIYLPQDFLTEKAFLLRCQPYYTNVNVAFLEDESTIQEDGKYHNDSKKYAKHGFVYDEKRPIRLAVNDKTYQDQVSVGGQNRNLSKWLKPLNQTLPAGSLQMRFFSSIVYDNIPEFTSNRNNDLSRAFHQAINKGLKENSNINFRIDMPNNITHEFELNLQRLKAFAPPEVLEFCFTGRKLRED